METLKAIATRKSTKSYNGEQIRQDKLDTILAAGCAAPVCNDKDALRKLQIPEGYLPVASVARGYAAKPVSRERDLAITIHTNRL